MSDIVPAGQSLFDSIRMIDEQGTEYWSARELADILGYRTNYRNFVAAIERAKKACENSGNAIFDHFAETRKMVKLGSGAQREVSDYHLTRYACYLVTQNADPTKDVVAQAQTYFAVKTRAQELQEAEEFALNEQSVAIEEMIARAKARVEARAKLSESYNELEEAASNKGMKGRRNFATLHGSGDMGMYTMSRDALAERHHLVPQQGERRVNVNDYEGTLEMGATLMRNGIAGADISRMQRATNQQMFQANFDAGRQISEVLLSHDIVPEDLPKEPHISVARQIANGQIPLEMLPSAPGENAQADPESSPLLEEENDQ